MEASVRGLLQAIGIGRSSERRRVASARSELAGAPAGLPRPLIALLVASVAVPLVLFGVAAWQNYLLVQHDARRQVVNTTGEMREQALKVLETYALVLDWVEDRASRLGWDRIPTAKGFRRLLADIDALPQVHTVRVIDPEGQVRASGRALPAKSKGVADRKYFSAQKRARIGIYVGRVHLGRLTHTREFDISRRLTMPDGRFGGIVTVSARPSYFRDFYRTLLHRPGIVGWLVRSDGAVLVRYPRPGRPVTLPPESRFMRAIARGRDSGIFHAKGVVDGVPRLYGYERVPGFPVYVVFGLPVSGITATWRANLVSYSLFAIPASLALLLMTLFALRQLRRQQLANWRWRTTARRLRREMRRRELVEEELRQSHKMEALGQLTGGVAHDFNNLLTVVGGTLEMLKDRQLDDRLEGKVSLALATVERGEKLVAQLLAFARRNPLKIESVDCNAALLGLQELLARSVGAGIAIKTDFAADLMPAAVDANQFELAIINLAINARDAMPQGGVLQIRSFNAPRHALPEELARSGRDFVAIEISDAGCGMPPEILARAFEPFFTTKEPGKGTGLGLSTVYGFARQSGGTAMIRSEPGRGTTVTLLLPRSGDDLVAPAQKAAGLPAAAAP